MTMNNVKKVVEFADDKLIPNVTMDLTTADAYDDSLTADKALEEVKTQLDKQAEEIKTSDPEIPETPVKNYATDKIKLDEEFTDFSIDDLKDNSSVSANDAMDTAKADGRSHRENDDDGMDTFLDYDMFDFIYGLVTDTYPKPKNPLNHKLRKFMYTGSDDYLNTNSNAGVGQVATDMNGSIVVYADDSSEFNDIKEICDLYHLSYDGPTPKSSSLSRWNFSFTIHVPMTSEGYPMMVDDYFANIGLTINDVMDADFSSKYNKRTAKLNKDAENELNTIRVEKVYHDYVTKAANSNDDLNIFIKELFTALDNAGLKYSKVALKKRFLKEFEDDFED